MRQDVSPYWNNVIFCFYRLFGGKVFTMTPQLQKELDKIYDKYDSLYPPGSINEHDFISYIISDIEGSEKLKEAKFKLSFWKSKNSDDIKYAVCTGKEIRKTILEWSKKDAKYLFKFVLFGDN